MAASEPNSWKDVYHAALLETNPEKFKDLLQQAQAAIEERLYAVGQDGTNREEIHNLQDALRNLHALSRNNHK